MTSGIYCITRNNNYYIGSSKNIESRVNHHFYLLKRNKHHCTKLQNLYNKTDNCDWTFRILQEADMTSLYELEQSWVDYLQITNCIVLNKLLTISVSPRNIGKPEFRTYHELLEIAAMKEI